MDDIVATLREEFVDLAAPSSDGGIAALLIAVLLARSSAPIARDARKPGGLRTPAGGTGRRAGGSGCAEAGMGASDMSRVLQGILAASDSRRWRHHQARERRSAGLTTRPASGNAAIATAAGLGKGATALVATVSRCKSCPSAAHRAQAQALRHGDHDRDASDDPAGLSVFSRAKAGLPRGSAGDPR